MFELTKPQKEIQKAAKEFAKGEFDKDQIYEFEKEGRFPTSIWKKAAELGFIGIHFPEEFSGGGLGLLENVIVVEQLCQCDPSMGSALAQSSAAAECIVRFGSDKLKSKYLPKIAEGEILSGKALSESIRGGDYRSIKTTASKKSDSWVLNGTKRHVINGGLAGVYVVLCRSEIDNQSKGDGLSLYAVAAESDGLSTGQQSKKLGNNMVASSELHFKDVAIPEENLIGKEGNGYNQLQQFLLEERVIIAAQALGTASAAFDRMMEYVKGREQFGKKIAQFQVSQHKIAEMATDIELSRLILYKAAWKIDQKKADSALCSMAKMKACRTAMEVGAHAIQLFGGYGYMTEYEVERFYRDAKSMEIREGARDLQKDLVAASVIGKIR